jgi:hypothetical protein
MPFIFSMKSSVRDANAAALGDSLAVSGAASAWTGLIEDAANITRANQANRVKKNFDFARTGKLSLFLMISISGVVARL